MAALLGVSLDWLARHSNLELDREMINSIQEVTRMKPQDKEHVFAMLEAFYSHYQNAGIPKACKVNAPHSFVMLKLVKLMPDVIFLNVSGIKRYQTMPSVTFTCRHYDFPLYSSSRIFFKINIKKNP